MNGFSQWARSHKPRIGAIAVVIVIVIVAATAAACGAFTAPAQQAGQQNAQTVEASENPNTGDNAGQTTSGTGGDANADSSSAQSSPSATANSNGGGQSSTTGSSGPGLGNTGGSGSSSGQSSQASNHTHTWVNHEATRKVWVSKWVTVPDYETKKVAVANRYIFSYDGYSTTNISDAKAHARKLIMQDAPDNYRTEAVYETQKVKTGSHKEDQGHYKTETYVDYVYCSSCGARK